MPNESDVASATPRIGVTSVGVVAKTTEPVPVAVVDPVPPFKIGSAVPDRPIARVPEEVTGDPDIERNAGTDKPTDVTDPVEGVVQTGEPDTTVRTCPFVPTVPRPVPPEATARGVEIVNVPVIEQVPDVENPPDPLTLNSSTSVVDEVPAKKIWSTKFVGTWYRTNEAPSPNPANWKSSVDVFKVILRAATPEKFTDVAAAAPIVGVTSVGDVANTTEPVPVAVVDPVPPLRIGRAVPDRPIASVPEEVMGDPEIERNEGTVAATDVTVPTTGVVHKRDVPFEVRT